MSNEPDSDFQFLLDGEANAPGPKQGDILVGRVLAVDAQGMVVDLGQKRDGVVPRADLDKLAQEGVTYQVGETIPVVVLSLEDKDGNMLVSASQARQQKDWITADQLLASQEVWEGTVIGHNRGGLIVQFGELRAFVPASHLTDLPRGITENERAGKLAALRGRRMGFKVVEVDRARRRLVLSQRKALREYRDQQKAHLLDGLAEGQVLKGVVTGLRDFGAFVDLGGADGLVHISEISWQRVKHPRDVLKVGQEVEVQILKIDREGKRIGLSLKRRQPDPWTSVAERFHAGQVALGTVTRVTTFGAFVDLGEGIEGLLHSNQLAGHPPVEEGSAIQVKVLNVDPARQRIALGLNQAQEQLPAPEAPRETNEDEA